MPKQLSAPTTRPGHRRLQALAEDLSEEVEVGPLLDRILAHSTRLLDGAAGSISLVDEDAGYYRKAADLGVACSSGQVFPLDEGVTGQVVAERRPVVLDRYAAVTGGHLPTGDPVAEGGVVAVPIWWRDAIIGADVVFAGRRRQFTTTEVDRLETSRPGRRRGHHQRPPAGRGGGGGTSVDRRRRARRRHPGPGHGPAGAARRRGGPGLGTGTGVGAGGGSPRARPGP